VQVELLIAAISVPTPATVAWHAWRMGRRTDAIITIGGLVFVLEWKVGERDFPRHAIEQAHGYALDLKNFHVTSHEKAIVPLLIATETLPQQLGLGFWAPDRVHEPIRVNPLDVLPTISQMLATGNASAFDARVWAAGAYRPTFSIIEAAEALYRGHDVTEISRSEAGAKNLTRIAAAIEAVVERMKAQGGKAICFVTGVPGAGKTLAGLNIAGNRHRRGCDLPVGQRAARRCAARSLEARCTQPQGPARSA
jgi:hypothetical protein